MRLPYEIEEGVREYIKELKAKKYDPISREEEKELLKRYKKDKDIEARNKLITANLRYACKLVNSYVGKGLTYFELISEVNDGLMESIEKFNGKYDVRLLTYSKWWMLQRMRAAIEKKVKDGERNIGIEEASKKKASKSIRKCDVKDENEEQEDIDNGENEWIEEEETDAESENNDKNILLSRLYTVLNEKEAEILNLYFGRTSEKPLTLSEIGEIYGITKERVRKIVETAMRKLRCEAVASDDIADDLFF